MHSACELLYGKEMNQVYIFPSFGLLLNFGQNLRVSEEEVFLCQKSISSARRSQRILLTLTSSPTLIEFPPHPGRRTLSPVLTVVGTTFPSLSGAPGPTAITVASGKGLVVDDWGRKIPVAVF